MTRKESKLKKKLKEQERVASSSGAAPEVPEERPFEIKEIEGKGMGVIATRDIKAGELILKEKPLVNHSTRSGLAGLDRLVAALSRSDREDYDSLYVTPALDSLPRHLAIFKTNAIELGAKAEKGGLFVMGSRFNHSCRPNCSRSWDEKQGVEWFIANRSIKEGEEVSIYYTGMNKSKAVRQAELKEMFGFDCRCEACSLSPPEVIASDARRKVIYETSESLVQLSDHPLKLIKAVNKALRLLKEEGITLLGAELAFSPLLACLFTGDEANANLWIDKTLELEVVEAGRWSSAYKDVESWKGNPALSPHWRYLCKMGLPSETLERPE